MKIYYFCYVGLLLLVILKLEYLGIDPWACYTNINNNRKMAYLDDSCKMGILTQALTYTYLEVQYSQIFLIPQLLFADISLR